MDLLKVFFSALFSLALIFVITKLLGNRQVSQFKLFDYVNGITIGSITAELATELENPERPLIALAVYGVVCFFVTLIELKSLRARRTLNGAPTVLMQSGKLLRENFRKAKLDVNDFLSQCRMLGYFDLTEIELAVLEPSGQLSVLPKESARPAKLSDLHPPEKNASASIGVIYDGKVMEDALKATGHEHDWLERQVRRQGYHIKDVFLATCDGEGNLRAFPAKEDAGNSFFCVTE